MIHILLHGHYPLDKIKLETLLVNYREFLSLNINEGSLNVLGCMGKSNTFSFTFHKTNH